MSLCELQVDKIKLRAKTKTQIGQIDSRNNNLAVYNTACHLPNC